MRMGSITYKRQVTETTINSLRDDLTSQDRGEAYIDDIDKLCNSFISIIHDLCDENLSPCAVLRCKITNT